MPNDHDLTTKRHGQAPSDDDIFWPEAMRHVQVDMMRSAQWAAGGVLALNVASLWLIEPMIAGLSFLSAEGPARLGGVATVGMGHAVLWLLPLICWSISAIWALRVFTVRRYRYFSNSPDSTREAVMRIARKKTQQLQWSIGFWAVGMTILIVQLSFGFV